MHQTCVRKLFLSFHLNYIVYPVTSTCKVIWMLTWGYTCTFKGCLPVCWLYLSRLSWPIIFVCLIVTINTNNNNLNIVSFYLNSQFQNKLKKNVLYMYIVYTYMYWYLFFMDILNELHCRFCLLSMINVTLYHYI
jgi:hypothetical protein